MGSRRVPGPRDRLTGIWPLAAAVTAWRARHGADPRDRARQPAAVGALAGVAVAAVLGWSSLARRAPGPPPSWLHLGWFWLTVSQAYVLAGLIVLAAAGWAALRSPGCGTGASGGMQGNELFPAGLRSRG